MWRSADVHMRMHKYCQLLQHILTELHMCSLNEAANFIRIGNRTRENGPTREDSTPGASQTRRRSAKVRLRQVAARRRKEELMPKKIETSFGAGAACHKFFDKASMMGRTEWRPKFWSLAKADGATGAKGIRAVSVIADQPVATGARSAVRLDSSRHFDVAGSTMARRAASRRGTGALV